MIRRVPRTFLEAVVMKKEDIVAAELDKINTKWRAHEQELKVFLHAHPVLAQDLPLLLKIVIPSQGARRKR